MTQLNCIQLLSTARPQPAPNIPVTERAKRTGLSERMYAWRGGADVRVAGRALGEGVADCRGVNSIALTVAMCDICVACLGSRVVE